MEKAVSSISKTSIEENKWIEIKSFYSLNFSKTELRGHKHKAIEIMYVIKGKCIVGISGKKIVLKKNNYIIINSDVWHTLEITADGCQIMNLEFVECDSIDLFSMQEIRKTDPLFCQWFSTELQYDTGDDMGEIYDYIKNIIFTLKKNQKRQDYFVNCNLVLLLKKIEDKIESKRTIHDKYVEFIENYLIENLHEPIKVEHIASELKLNTNYIHKIYKQKMGRTILEELIELRLSKAKELLELSDYSIMQISILCGFSSSQYFSYVFKRNTGLTPVQYRERKVVFREMLDNQQEII